MTRRILPITVLIVLALLIWLGYQKKLSNTLASDFRFKVEEVSSIERILLTHRDGEQVDLRKQKEGWTVNNSYQARANAIENLLDVVTRVDLQFIPTEAAMRTMVADLSTQGVRVDILGHQDEILRSYYVGGATPDERGTFMIMNGSDQPAVTYIPGWEGGLRARYVMQPIEWRSRMIYELQSDRIGQVSIDYPKQQSQSFEIIKTEQSSKVIPLYEQVTGKGQPRKGTVEAYLRGFGSIGAESILMDPSLAAALQEKLPFAIIRCETDRGESVLRLFPIVEQLESGPDHIERYHAIDEAGTLYLVQQRIFEKLFWSYDSFFESPKD
ncbi:MAG: DUF4340 domain-containing protein [Saprospiraceae bacterium]|nr:DUF4340 domain-containing protein [Saprospiraceae bacterium]